MPETIITYRLRGWGRSTEMRRTSNELSHCRRRARRTSNELSHCHKHPGVLPINGRKTIGALHESRYVAEMLSMGFRGFPDKLKMRKRRRVLADGVSASSAGACRQRKEVRSLLRGSSRRISSYPHRWTGRWSVRRTHRQSSSKRRSRALRRKLRRPTSRFHKQSDRSAALDRTRP